MKSNTKLHNTIIGILTLCLLLTGLTACAPGGEKEPEPTETYLAQGTIPASAKIYPVADEEFPMVVRNNADGTLTAEDIATITHCIDLRAAIDDTRSDKELDPDDYTFLKAISLEAMQENMSNLEFDYKVEAVQILDIHVNYPDSGDVAVTHMIVEQGKTKNDPEALRTEIGVLYFKKVNGNWYANSYDFVCKELSDSIVYSRDEFTNQLQIKLIE